MDVMKVDLRLKCLKALTQAGSRPPERHEVGRGVPGDIVEASELVRDLGYRCSKDGLPSVLEVEPSRALRLQASFGATHLVEGNQEDTHDRRPGKEEEPQSVILVYADLLTAIVRLLLKGVGELSIVRCRRRRGHGLGLDRGVSVL